MRHCGPGHPTAVQTPAQPTRTTVTSRGSPRTAFQSLPLPPVLGHRGFALCSRLSSLSRRFLQWGRTGCSLCPGLCPGHSVCGGPPGAWPGPRPARVPSSRSPAGFPPSGPFRGPLSPFCGGIAGSHGGSPVSVNTEPAALARRALHLRFESRTTSKSAAGEAPSRVTRASMGPRGHYLNRVSFLSGTHSEVFSGQCFSQHFEVAFLREQQVRL